MQDTYVSYKCRTCRKEFVVLKEDIESMAVGRYLACPFCNSKRISKEKVSDSLKECMGARVYRRVKGALREIN